MSSVPSRLDVSVLGPPLVEVDGRPIEVDTRKAIALVAYLAVTRATPTRDELVALLWPDADPERGRGALRRTLSTVRAALGGRWVEAGRDRVVLERKDLRLDLDEEGALTQVDHGHDPSVACPSCIPGLTRAVDLHRGEFMGGFAIRGCPEFDDWQFSQAEAGRRRLGRLLERLSAAQASAGDYPSAAESARRRVAIAPLDEAAHRQLMLALTWSGRRDEAIRQFRECARVLDAELGVPPLDETTGLFEAISAGREPPPPGGPARLEVRIEADLVPLPSGMVGREDELARLLEAVGGGGLVVVEGDTGIGKSTLLAAAAERLVGQGRTVAVARAHSGEDHLPYVLVRDLLRAAMVAGRPDRLGPQAAPAALLLPELSVHGLAPPSLEGPGAEVRFHDGLAAALAALLGELGVLVADEAHLADEESVRFLDYLSHRLDEFRVALVVAVRSDEPGPHEPLVRNARARGTLVELGPLAGDDVGSLVERVTGRRDRALVTSLAERTGGNPLFLVECLVADDPVTAAPSNLRDLVRARIERIGEVSGQVAAAVAVLERDAPHPSIREVSGRSDEETLTALERLVASRILTEEPSGFRFVHQVVASLVYEGLGGARRAHLHSRAADALRRRRGYGSIGVVARHLERAGRLEEAADAHAEAGAESLSVRAHDAARAHLEAALALGHPDPHRIHLGLAESAVRQGDYRRGLVALQAAAGYRDDAETRHRLGDLYRRWGRLDMAVGELEAAVELAGDAEGRARALADLADTHRRRGDRAAAGEMAGRSLRLAGEAEDPVASAQAHNLLGMLEEDVEAARRHLETAVRLSRGLDHPDLEAAALNNLSRLLLRAGLAEEAVTVAEEALETIRRVGDRHRMAALHSNLADALHAAGGHDAALVHLKESATLLADMGVAEGGWEPEVWKLADW